MNKVLSAIRIAFRALRINKLRSALTMLGIIIGVGAVIAMVAVGSGATQRIQEQIASIGSNVIMVMPGSVTASGIRLGAGNAVSLTIDDARTIERDCPAVAAVAPSSRGGAQVINANNNWATQILGTTPEYLTIREITVDNGSPFTEQDVDSAAKVALLGQTVVNNLFNGDDPVGQVIRIKQVPFTVVGTLAPKGQSPSGQDQDDVILVPITTGQKKLFGVNQARANSVGSLMVQARGPESMVLAEDQMRTLLRQRHHLQPSQDDDFTVRNLEEVFKAQETSSQVMSILLAAIASVSLIVGGIGIMNIMLVSVTERTREIGLRQSIGAKTKDILTQFLVEAVTLSIMGGVIGIILGTIASKLISYFAQWSTVVSPAAIAMAFVFSALVGVF